MSLQRQIAHNSIAQIIGKGLSTALGVVAVMLMTRALGTEKFGWYITATGFLQFAGLLSDFGFTVVAASMLSEPRFEKKHLYNSFFTWRFITALIANILTPLIILFFPYSIEIKIATAVLALSFFCIYLTQIFTAYYQVKLKMHIQVTGEVLGRLALVIGIFLLARGNSVFMPVIIAVTLASVINTIYLWWKSEPVKFYFDKEISKAIWHKMWPVALSVIFNAFYLQGDKVILPLFASQSEVGIYGAASRVVESIIPIPALLMGMMLPLITYSWSRGDTANFRQRLQWGFNLISLCLLPITAGTVILAGPIMKFVAGQQFAGSGIFLAILGWKMIGISFGMVFGHVLLAMGKQKKYLWIFLSDAILSTIGFIIFIPRYGAIGASYVSLFSEIYAGIFLFIMSGYYARFIPHWGAWIKIALSSTVMGTIVYYLQPMNILVSIAIGAAVYTICILATGVVSRQMLKEILRVKKIEAESPTESIV